MTINFQISNDSSLKSAIIRDSIAHENALPIRDETCRSRFFFQPQPTEKVCLFFHGFTASPAQFVPIGEAFFQAGYNVLIPLLPGHGIAGKWDGENPPPLPEEQETYQQFGLHWLQLAQSLGKQVVVGGLSGGSTLAAWLALECPEQIDHALLFAPYLSGSNKVVDLFVRVFNIYFEWQTDPGVEHFGYDGFLMPALRVFLDMGADILKRADQHKAAPMLLLSSESDKAVGLKEHEALFEAVLKFQPKSWYYRFDRVLDIQHNMMTKAEGNEYLNLLIILAQAYVESDLTWAEVEEIRILIQQGYSVKAVVNQLHLQEKISPEMAILMASSFWIEGKLESSQG